MVSTLKRYFSSAHNTFVITNILSTDTFGIANEYLIIVEKSLKEIAFFSSVLNTSHYYSVTLFEQFELVSHELRDYIHQITYPRLHSNPGREIPSKRTSLKIVRCSSNFGNGSQVACRPRSTNSVSTGRDRKRGLHSKTFDGSLFSDV